MAAVLPAADWPAASLEIDVTEAALQSDPEAALANIEALRQLGVRVSLDDFGTGDSSLALLRRFPLSAVKIDRSLTQGLGRPGLDKDLVSGLILMARSLRLEVHVEGVETEAQRQFLAEAGCTAWQGFLYAPPLDADSLERRARVERSRRGANDEAVRAQPRPP